VQSAATECLDERLGRGHVVDHDVVVDLLWASRVAPDRRLVVGRQLERHPRVPLIHGDDDPVRRRIGHRQSEECGPEPCRGRRVGRVVHDVVQPAEGSHSGIVSCPCPRWALTR